MNPGPDVHPPTVTDDPPPPHYLKPKENLPVSGSRKGSGVGAVLRGAGLRDPDVLLRRRPLVPPHKYGTASESFKEV